MLKLTDACGTEYEIEYSAHDQVRNVMLRHIEHLEQQLAAEREACAKICDDRATEASVACLRDAYYEADDCAAAIRARGQP